MINEWYYVDEGSQKGPISAEQLYNLYSGGVIEDSTLVWHQGLPKWTRISEIPQSEYHPQEAQMDHVEGSENVAVVKKIRTERMVFTGSGKEYFGIWIVNLLLTIITLGIYTPWARVRTRRYFYQHTKFFGEPFDYLADPKKILVGLVIVVAFFTVYTGMEFIDPVLAVLVSLVFYAVFPLLIFKSHHFKAANSSYRNVTFRFMGSLGEAYAWYLGMYILAVFTLGLLLPYVIYKQKEYFFNNLRFGHLRGNFHGQVGVFYAIYLGGGILIFGTAFATMAGAISILTSDAGAPEAGFVVTVFLMYAIIILGIMFIHGLILKHIWNNLSLGKQVDFKCDLSALKYLWIVFSNILLTIATLGIFAPWAKVRLHKYRVESVSATLEGNMDKITGDAYENMSAISDTATEFFDFEIGF